jgi:hypothetical protein
VGGGQWAVGGGQGRPEKAEMSIRSYRELEVWQKAMNLVVDCYKLAVSSRTLKFMAWQVNFSEL